MRRYLFKRTVKKETEKKPHCTQCCVTVRAEVFRQHQCAKFFMALEFELLGTVI